VLFRNSYCVSSDCNDHIWSWIAWYITIMFHIFDENFTIRDAPDPSFPFWPTYFSVFHSLIHSWLASIACFWLAGVGAVYWVLIGWLGSNWQVLELCAVFCEVADLRAIICRLIMESSADCPLLAGIAHWAVLSPTELTVAVECLQHFFEVFVCPQTELQ